VLNKARCFGLMLFFFVVLEAYFFNNQLIFRYMFSFFAKQCAIALCFSVSSSMAQTLSSGDVVIVGYDFKDPDEFSLLTLVDLSPGTSFYITDCGWDSNLSAFRTGEGLISYTVPSTGITAGSQIHYPADAGFVTQGISGFFGLSVAGDQLLVFQGTFVNPRFIFGLTDYDGGWLSTSVSPTNQTSHRPPGLIDGQNALALNQYINAQFECSYPFSSRQEFLNRLTDPHQWIKSRDRVTLPIMGCGFDDLLEQHIAWSYRMEDAHTIFLSVQSTNIHNIHQETINWLLYEDGKELALSCQKLNNESYVCELPKTNSELLIKPCRDNQYCEYYKKIDWIKNVGISWTLHESGHVEIMFTEMQKPFSFALYDTKGRVLLTENKEAAQTFDLKGLSPGFYILNIVLTSTEHKISICVPN
jgi:hypothetical protein